MNSTELQKRIKSMAAKVIDFVEHFPRSYACEVIGKQLTRSATSVAANYRANPIVEVSRPRQYDM